MKADLKTVQYVADLAAIRLDEAEALKFSQDLTAIISYMEDLMAIDTGETRPMEHVLPLHNAFREDVVTNGNQHDALLEVSSKTEEGCYLVPNVVE